MHNMHSHSHPFPVSKPRPIHVLNQNLDSLMFWLHSWFIPSFNPWNTDSCFAGNLPAKVVDLLQGCGGANCTPLRLSNTP